MKIVDRNLLIYAVNEDAPLLVTDAHLAALAIECPRAPRPPEAPVATVLTGERACVTG